MNSSLRWYAPQTGSELSDATKCIFRAMWGEPVDTVLQSIDALPQLRAMHAATTSEQAKLDLERLIELLHEHDYLVVREVR